VIKAAAGLIVLAGTFAHAEDSGRAERRAAYKQWDAGVALVLAGEEGKAKEAWERCLRLDPENADCRAGLKLLSRKGSALDAPAAVRPPAPAPEIEESQAAHPKAAIEPRRTAVKHWNAGIIHFQAGHYRKALAEWRLCLAQDKMNKDCRTGVDRVEGRLALPERPRAAPTAEPKDPKEARTRAAFRHWNAGILHYQKGELEKARKEWMKCRKQDPTNMDCHTGLLRIARQYGGK
jgi:tetratricopeptide (TPR) repeat protein